MFEDLNNIEVKDSKRKDEGRIEVIDDSKTKLAHVAEDEIDLNKFFEEGEETFNDLELQKYLIKC